MRLIIKAAIVAITVAVSVLAFPISAVKGSDQQKLVFEIDPTLREPKVLYRPYPSDFKPKVKKVTSKTNTKVSNKKPFNPCNCWSYVLYKRGGRIPTGYQTAVNYPVNSKTPQIGAVVMTYEGNRRVGHFGIIADFDSESITIDDWNYKRCQHTVRKLPIDSPLIKGYYL